MPYVERNKDKVIFAIYNRPQPKRTEEYLLDDNAEILEFLNPAQPPAVTDIVLSIDNQVITTAQVATVTANIQGVSVEDFPCYITVNGPPAEKADIVAEQVVREFSSAEPGLFKVEFFVSDKTKAVIIEVV